MNRVADKTISQGLQLHPLHEIQVGRKGRFAAPVLHKFCTPEEPTSADMANIGMVAEGLVQLFAKPGAIIYDLAAEILPFNDALYSEGTRAGGRVTCKRYDRQ